HPVAHPDLEGPGLHDGAVELGHRHAAGILDHVDAPEEGEAAADGAEEAILRIPDLQAVEDEAERPPKAEEGTVLFVADLHPEGALGLEDLADEPAAEPAAQLEGEEVT